MSSKRLPVDGDSLRGREEGFIVTFSGSILTTRWHVLRRRNQLPRFCGRSNRSFCRPENKRPEHSAERRTPHKHFHHLLSSSSSSSSRYLRSLTSRSSSSPFWWSGFDASFISLWKVSSVKIEAKNNLKSWAEDSKIYIREKGYVSFATTEGKRGAVVEGKVARKILIKEG